MLMCLDGRSCFHSLYFGPQTLGMFLFWKLLIQFQDILLHYFFNTFFSHPFSYFSFCGTPGIWMFVTSIATLIYLSVRLDFPLLRLFVVHYVEYFSLLLGQSPQRGNPGRCKCYYKRSGMGAGLLLISINNFHFHCAHTCLLRYPQAIVLVEFL